MWVCWKWYPIGWGVVSRVWVGVRVGSSCPRVEQPPRPHPKSLLLAPPSPQKQRPSPWSKISAPLIPALLRRPQRRSSVSWEFSRTVHYTLVVIITSTSRPTVTQSPSSPGLPGTYGSGSTGPLPRPLVLRPRQLAAPRPLA